MKRMLNNIFLTIFNKTAYILVFFFVVTTLFISGGIFNVEGDKKSSLKMLSEIPSYIDSAEANQQLEDIQKYYRWF